jgi:hypothetical protein
VQGFGDGADLVDLDQCCVGDLAVDGFGDDGRVGDQDVVADELDTVTEAFVEGLSSRPSRIRRGRLRCSTPGIG